MAAESGDWVEVRSPNFVVISDGGAKAAQTVAAEFEQFRAVYRSAFPKARTDPGKPVIVLAVRDSKTWAALLPAFASRTGGVRPAGVFTPGEERHYAAIQILDSGANPRRNIYHEYVHLMNRLNFRQLPVWLNEGLAEFYANTAIRPGSAEVGLPDEHHLNLLRTRALLPLGDFFAVDQASPEYMEKERASIFYAQAWLLTHFLVLGDDPAYRDRLDSLLEQIVRGTPPEEATAQALGPLPDLQMKLEAYSRSIAFRAIVVQTSSDFVGSAFPARPMRPAEAKSVQGDFLFQTQRPTEARAFLEEALRDEPQLTAPKETLGRLALLEGNHKEARAWFTKAIEGDSQSFLVHYYFARLTAEESQDREDIEIAEDHLERSVELNPNFASGCAALSGFYAARPGMIHAALDLARRAAELEPETLGFALNLGGILLRMERVDEAIEIGERTLARAITEKDRRDARTFLESARRYQTKLAEWKRIEETSRAAAEERRKRHADASRGETPPSPGPAQLTAPPQTQCGAGPKRQVFGSGVEGWIASVTCRGKTMILALDVAAYRLNLRSADYFETGFQTSGWKPPKDFDPCLHLKGRRAIVIYRAVRGKGYNGEILSIEVTQ
jgi:tetratricopeptide (TPR) repeat protein